MTDSLEEKKVGYYYEKSKVQMLRNSPKIGNTYYPKVRINKNTIIGIVSPKATDFPIYCWLHQIFDFSCEHHRYSQGWTRPHENTLQCKTLNYRTKGYQYLFY